MKLLISIVLGSTMIVIGTIQCAENILQKRRVTLDEQKQKQQEAQLKEGVMRRDDSWLGSDEKRRQDEREQLERRLEWGVIRSKNLESDLKHIKDEKEKVDSDLRNIRAELKKYNDDVYDNCSFKLFKYCCPCIVSILDEGIKAAVCR